MYLILNTSYKLIMNFDKMNGYEFECFIAKLLREIGFVVEETSLSGDGLIDLITYCNESISKENIYFNASVERKYW